MAKCMHGQEVSAWDHERWRKKKKKKRAFEQLAKGVPRVAQFDKEHFFETQTAIISSYLLPEQRRSMDMCNRMDGRIFLFAEHNFRLHVNRIFHSIFDPILSEPNRIFGLLNLSIDNP